MQAELEAQEQQKKIRFTLYLGPEENAALEKRQAEYGVTKAEQIRRAIRTQYANSLVARSA